MGTFNGLSLWWHRLQTRRKMQRVFGRGEDPFSYRTSTYERARLDAMAAALAGRAYGRALEVGCAEGDFTERLLGLSSDVTALDISATALSRARRRLNGRAQFVEADIRSWGPPPGLRYELIVLADVLYYLDKPLVRVQFENLFAAVFSWQAPGGRLLLAHAFATDAELSHRRGFRERFERQGLRLVSETVAGRGFAGPVACLLSLLEK
ncbi:MAG: class I SAM-dependent methyltransferase [Elusimicrobia bacterium]|nr:class I SAM-dependent methyltransferase [Elusimicrobiota bacterium]